MTTSTILRISFAAFLAAAYFGLPYLFRNGGEEGHSIAPGQVEVIALETAGGDGFILERGADGWLVDECGNIPADTNLLSAFFDGLNTARFVSRAEIPDIEWESAPVLRMATGRGHTEEWRLGPRSRPFQEQFIQKDDEVFLVSFDVSASLGLWEGDFPWNGDRIIQRTPVAVEDGAVVSIYLRNPFTEYFFERTDEVIETRENEYGELEELYRWTTEGDHSERRPLASAMYRYSEYLKLLVVEGAGRPFSEERDVVREVTFTTDTGEIFELAMSGSIGEENERMVWMRQPVKRGPYRLSERFFQGFTPPGATLFEERSLFDTGAMDAAMIAYERDGHQLILNRDADDNWQIARPQLPYSIYTPDPEPGRPPESTAEFYARRIDTILTEEFFDPGTEAGGDVSDDIFENPAVRLIVEDRSGERMEIRLSHPVANTDHVFVWSDGEIGVKHKRSLRSLAPNVETFLNPAEIQGREIEW